MSHPFLSRLEVFLVRLLSRSPHIGLILIKEHGGSLIWVVEDKSDPSPLHKVAVTAEDREPPSMRFERAFHAPDAER